MKSAASPSGLDFLAGGGEMGAFVRSHDWAQTPLGPPAQWPQALRTALRLLLNTGHPMYIFWGDEGYCFYNDAYRQSIGSERHPGSLGRPARAVWEEIWPIIGPQIDQVMSGGPATWHENALVPITRDGRHDEVYWTYSYGPIDDDTASNGVGGVLVVCTETTGAVLADRRRQEEMNRQRRIFEQAPAFIIVMDGPNHAVEFVNNAHRTLFNSKDWVGKSIREAFPSIAEQGFFEALDKVYATGRTYHADQERVRYRRTPDSPEETRYLTFIYAPIFDAEGAVTGIFSEGFDVTAAKIGSLALEHESRNLETLNRTGAAIAAELDLERVVQMVTDAGTDLCGAEFGAFFYATQDESGGRLMLFTLTGADRSAFENFGMPRATPVFKPTFDGEAVVRSDDIRRDPRYGHNAPNKGIPEGHLPVRSYLAIPVISRSGEVIGGLFFGHSEPAQFTERHEELLVGIAGQAAIAIDNARLYRALQQSNETLEQRVAEEVGSRARAEEALRQAQKMEAVGQLTGGIAHDFNNMLAIVISGIDIAKRRLERGDRGVEELLDGAREGATRAATLTQRLLAFSRQSPLSPRVLSLNEVVAGMSDLLQRTLGERIELETVLTGGLWRAFVDPNELESAIVNLALNSRDAMAEGGKLTIETANIYLDDAYSAEQFGLAAGQYVMVAVTDVGHGVPPELLERVFDPFFTTKAVGKGTGLGLSMVYGFAKQSGGHVRIYSEEGKGATVKIYLPRHFGSPEDMGQVIREGAVPADLTGREIVLLVEDEDRVRQMSAAALRDLGYTVHEAASGETALAMYEALPRVDLVFTDIVMAGMTGRQLADALRAANPAIKILYTTGYTRNAMVQNGVLDPGVVLLSKPFSVEDLARKVRQVLDGD